jgi:nicotinamide mononucleotide (NMN) deamidase PncC
MDAVLKSVVEAIHASPTQAVLSVSGGASQAMGWLLSVPRASSTVLEVTIPYSRISMLQLLGKMPAQFVSRETAEEMALRAYNRALGLSTTDVPVAGIGFTGALTSATPKRGEHRCHIAARTQSGLWYYNLTLSKGLRDRRGEDEVTSRILIKRSLYLILGSRCFNCWERCRHNL